MKIIVVGGTGAIGKAVVKALSSRHEVIATGYKDGDIQVDVTEEKSIKHMFTSVGKVDALVATCGSVHFAPLAQMRAEHYEIGLKNKLMGQVNLVSLGMKHLNDGGSFTLTSGILNHDPIREGASAAMVNGALEGFVKAAAIEMPGNMRINLVSPTVLLESMDIYGEYFRGYVPVPVAEVALAYVKSVEGAQTGQVYKVGWV